MRTLRRRLDRVGFRMVPRPDPSFVAYARALLVWGGEVPTPARVQAVAAALTRLPFPAG